MLVSVARSSVVKAAHGVTRKLEHLAHAAAAADGREGEQMQHDVLGCHAGGHVALEFDAQQLRHRHAHGPGDEGIRHVRGADAESDASQRAAVRVWESVPTTTWPGRA